MSITLQAVSEEDIAAGQIELTDLWWARLGEDVFGPFQTAALKQYAHSNTELFTQVLVCQVNQENWQTYSSCPQFQVQQRRRPQLMSAQQLQTSDRWFVAINGHRQGPHSTADVKKMLAAGQLHIADMVSNDDGFTWMKLYHAREFDHKPRSVDSLPMAPLEEQLKSSRQELLAQGLLENPLKDGLASLAYLGHRKSHAPAIELTDLELPQTSSGPKLEVSQKMWAYGGAAAALMAFILVMMTVFTGPAPDASLLALEQDIPVKDPSARLKRTPASSQKSAKKNRYPNRAPSENYRGNRSPASYQPTHIGSPPAMVRERRFEDFRQTHDDYPQEQPEPMDVVEPDPRAEYAQTDEGQEQSLVRNPAQQQDPAQDEYRFEPPAEAGQVVEEVGDF